jgi:phosphoglycerate dehydrogenase-like enzyme
MAEPIDSSVMNATNNLTTDDCAKGLVVNALSKRTTRIGFIGLKLMGSRLTRRLQSQGWNVQAWNRSWSLGSSIPHKSRELLSSCKSIIF